MTAARQHYRRALVVGLFVVSALLVPLKPVFACVMMNNVVERCCCDQPHEADRQSEQAEADDCCDSFYLPEARVDSLSASSKALTATQFDDPELPPVLPPREVGPDPPALYEINRSACLSTPPAWLEGSQIYLLTLRLRN